MGRSQRHKIEEQGYSSRGQIYEQGAINDQVLKSIGGAIAGAQPVLSSISPTTAVLAAAELTLTATGTGFTNGDTVIMFKGNPLATTFVSATSLTALVLPATHGVGAWPVQVRKGGLLLSAATKTFTIAAAAVREGVEHPIAALGVILAAAQGPLEPPPDDEATKKTGKKRAKSD